MFKKTDNMLMKSKIRRLFFFLILLFLLLFHRYGVYLNTYINYYPSEDLNEEKENIISKG